MEKDIRRNIAELAEIATQLRIAKVGDFTVVDWQLKKLLEAILFLDKEPGCKEAVEAVRTNIALFYMNRVDGIRIAESIEKLVEQLKMNVQ